MRQGSVSSAEFVEVYTRTKDRSLGVVVTLGLRPDEAEEALAEAYARAWGRWGKVRTMDSPEAWVIRTAVNANISWWRKRRKESPYEVLPESPVTPATDRPDLVAALRGFHRASETSSSCGTCSTWTPDRRQPSWASRRAPSRRSSTGRSLRCEHTSPNPKGSADDRINGSRTAE